MATNFTLIDNFCSLKLKLTMEYKMKLQHVVLTKTQLLYGSFSA